ncbi:hypothetical protein [Sinimarinibacterium flocculans]|uniref:hypothetical protein n=1 Tax=Sinimarinibacterium flocculans TaxID=985250 RepID=UPI002492E629|nr:hypothetical protein [Sinimarinibacterium flocculans]
MTTKIVHEWSKQALFAKAQLYAEAMSDNADSDWQFGLWSALTLEVLLRSSIANVSPALVADNQDWTNILYGLGVSPKKPKFVPKSATATDLVIRAEELIADFTREHASFCISHFARRNSELHTGNMSFSNIGSSTWLPTFYSACSVLLAAQSETLESLFGGEIAKQAEEDISALKDETAKSVKGTINAHKTVWEQKTEQERATAVAQAETASLRHYGHRIPCPACLSVALLQGKASSVPKRTVDDDGISERQVMKPELFSCVACGLKISGYSRLLAAGLGDTFVSTSHYDAVEYFEVDIEEHIRGMMEDDNNEP